jgi:ribosomal-protein-alanine N-acetyltransferase
MKNSEDNENITIRRMTVVDVEAISEIEERVFSMPWRAVDFLEMIEAEYARFYVATEEGTPVGAIGGRVIAGDGQITNIVVDEPFRRRGIARAMLKHMLADIADEAETVSLETRAGNVAAIRLYEEFGFRLVARRRDFYEKPTEDALVYLKGR